MKNIHILPTDKPSRLKQNKITKKISLVNKGIDLTSYTPINIYITSDEEIKEGDWCLDETFKPVNLWFYPEKLKGKIILTTDQDLINDGVQAIPDEFLEWFVKNPSCEKVEVKKGKIKLNDDGEEYGFPDMSLYKIIIPKEELKQETLEEFINKVDTPTDFDQFTFDEGIRVGAKWHQERSYSEEEVLELLRKAHFVEQNIDDWFEQFKKKKI